MATRSMYRRPPKKVELLKRTATYSAMSLAVIAIATFLVFFLLGYRRDWASGQIEQSGLVQFDSIPGGATVSVDGRSLGSSTPTKAALLPGNRLVSVTRDGYRSWTKTVDVKSGTLLWLDYVRLVPNQITQEELKSYPTVLSSLPSPDNKKLLVQNGNQIFDLVDISSDNPNYQALSLPSTLNADLTKLKVESLSPVGWDSGSRYIILKSNGPGATQWIVLDTKQPEKSKNVTAVLNISISDMKFFGTSGNVFYALSGSDIRKLDLSNGTISRSLVSGVSSFSIYDDRTVYYKGTVQSGGTDSNVVGIYRDGDDSPVVLKQSSTTTPSISVMSFHGSDYIAILYGEKLEIYHGNFPPSGSTVSEHIALDATLSVPAGVTSLQFSKKSDYLLIVSGDNYKVYAVEYQTISEFSLAGAIWQSNVDWLDNAHLYSTIDGSLTMRDFDGSNGAFIMMVSPVSKASLASSGKYIYAIKNTTSGYVLARAKMIN